MKPEEKSAPLLLFGLFLCMVGAKFMLIATYGNSTPFWDQWDAEAAAVYLPWAGGNLDLSQLAAAHNEHRILWTRLLGLLELRFNGGIWDPLFQMTVNAVLHGLAIVLLLGGLRRELPGHTWPGLILFSLFLALPFGWGNTLWGFQSQFYFLLLFGLSSIWLLTTSRPLDARWWLGFFILVAAYYSVASGFLAAPAVVVCYGIRMAQSKKPDTRTVIAIGLLLGYAALSYAWTPAVQANLPFRAASIHGFVVALFKALAVPFDSWPVLVGVAQFPLIWLAFHVVNADKDKPPARMPWFLIASALWIYLNAAAMAYGRGAGGMGPASRFMDTLYLGVILNAAALLYLRHRLRPRWGGILAGLWFTAMAAGMIGMFATKAIHEIRLVAQGHQFREANAMRFLSDFDRERMAALPLGAIPHESPEKLAAWLENPTVRSFLPTPMRAPLAAVQTNNWFFVENGTSPSTPALPFETVRGSHGPFGPSGTGRLDLSYDPPTKGGFLQIAVAGHPGAEGMALRIESLDGRLLADLAPRSDPGDQWRRIHVRAPREPFRIAAVDSSTRHWLAFAEPKEIGAGSLITIWLLGFWPLFAGLGLGLMAPAFFWRTSVGPAIPAGATPLPNQEIST